MVSAPSDDLRMSEFYDLWFDQSRRTPPRPPVPLRALGFLLATPLLLVQWCRTGAAWLDVRTRTDGAGDSGILTHVAGRARRWDAAA